MPYPGPTTFPGLPVYPGVTAFTVSNGRLTLFTTIPGVPAAPPTHGLVASAVRPDVQRWEQGLAWVPERCGSPYQLVPWCDVPEVGYVAPRAGAAYHRPVGLRTADECSTLGGPVDLERVRRVAVAQAPFAIARELWEGDLTQTDPYDLDGVSSTNAYLASPDATVVGASAANHSVGVGRLEQSALEATHGQQVMVHVPVMLLPQLADTVQPVGNQLITRAGNILVGDAGYPGTGPAGQAVGATVWIYATSPVAVLTSPWVIDTDDTSTVDRATNTRTVWATSVFAALFDPCVHLATEITL